MLGFTPTGAAPVGDDGGGTGSGVVPFNPTLTADTGVFLITGATATMHAGYSLAVGTGVFLFTGLDVLLKGRLIAQTGVFSLNVSANIQTGRKLSAGTGSYTLNGIANDMRPAYLLFATAGGFNLTGYPIATKVNRGFVPAVMAYHLTVSAAPSLTKRLPLTGATFALTGAVPTFSLGYSLNVSMGSFVLSGKAANLAAMRKMSAGSTAFALTGFDVVFHSVHTLTQVAGGFLFSASPTFKMLRNRKIVAATGTYTLSGATITTPTVRRTMALQPGQFILTGQPITTNHARSLSAGVGTFILSGHTATFQTGYTPFSATPGAFHLTGEPVEIIVQRKMVLSPGVFNVFTYDGQMNYTGADDLRTGQRWTIIETIEANDVTESKPGSETVQSPRNGLDCEAGSFIVSTPESMQLGRLMTLSPGEFEVN